MSVQKRILVTGAAGKVGQTFINRIRHELGFETVIIRALG